MGTRLYPLLGGDDDEIKVWYSLGLGMEMKMNFFYENEYGIAKSVSVSSVVIPGKDVYLNILRIEKQCLYNALNFFRL